MSFEFKFQIKCLLYLLNTLSGAMSERCPYPRLGSRSTLF